MKVIEDKPFQLKQVKGTIVDTRDQTSWSFTEKNIIHIELEQGSKKLFYEANDEFKQNQKLRELIEKKIRNLPGQIEYAISPSWKEDYELLLIEFKSLLEDSKK